MAKIMQARAETNKKTKFSDLDMPSAAYLRRKSKILKARAETNKKTKFSDLDMPSAAYLRRKSKILKARAETNKKTKFSDFMLLSVSVPNALCLFPVSGVCIYEKRTA